MTIKERMAAVNAVREQKELEALAAEAKRLQEEQEEKDRTAAEVAAVLSTTNLWVERTLGDLLSLYEKEQKPVEMQPLWGHFGIKTSDGWTLADLNRIYKARYFALEEAIEPYSKISLDDPVEYSNDEDDYSSPMRTKNSNWIDFRNWNSRFYAKLRIL